MRKYSASFFNRLAIALAASFILIGAVLIFFIQQLTTEYQKEIEQNLHLELAKHVVHDNKLVSNGVINHASLKKAFHSMMILGPSFEFYIIDPSGAVLTYSADPEQIKRKQIDLRPIRSFIDGTEPLPLVGDDPRSVNRLKIFSVAEIRDDNNLQGYLYIIIGGEIYDGLVDVVGWSHNLTLSVWTLAAALLFGLLMIMVWFSIITRPLKQLINDMENFKNSGFDAGSLPETSWREGSSDEIHRLGITFQAMARELKKQYKKVKNTDELRRELVTYASHDIRTPLASLQGYLETWQMRKYDLTMEEGEQLISVAEKNAMQVAKLVNQLFELAHLDSESAQINIEPLAVAELAQDVLQKLELSAQQANVTLEVEPKDPALMVVGDIEKLERVFTNLVENALRHCASGDSVVVRFKRCDAAIRVEIEDTGAGISPDEIDYIFDAYFRAQNSATRKSTNNGLGLAITKRILELHSSSISVSSSVGIGTVFQFDLPSYSISN